eukprot:2423-Heterococcus_DN1.PRE.2
MLTISNIARCSASEHDSNHTLLIAKRNTYCGLMFLLRYHNKYSGKCIVSARKAKPVLLAIVLVRAAMYRREDVKSQDVASQQQ